MKELKGICAASCTPFKEGGEEVDEDALKAHLDYLIEAGVHIILVCGGTGEFAYLRPEEKKRIVEISAKHINGRTDLMVQASAINTVDAVDYAKHAEDAGADGLLVLPPYFEGPDADGVYYHYEKIANAVNIPIVAYNIPVHSGFDITPQFFKRLMKIDNVKYIKDSTGDFIRIRELIKVAGDKAKVFNGADPIAFEALIAGSIGCIWGAANVMPKECVQLYDLIMANNLVKAKELWERMLPANLFFWNHIYNSSVKAATNLAGRRVGKCRKPVLALKDFELAELKEALKPLGI
ncbi:MAG: dihydrodipicolinate synthase family protein [Actinomycetota bacterium]|nr:dihydrodipicolinate synthase family protein [Actinomycetota bacterium]